MSYIFNADGDLWYRPLSDLFPSSVVKTTEAIAMEIYPNPASRELHINSSSLGTIHLYDALGRERMNAISDGEEITFDVSGLLNGTYFLRIGSEISGVEIAH